jgi:uncharacterized protein YjeT (DUF2065 family)
LIAEVVWAAGLVLAIEGLVIALAPGRIDALLEAFRRMPVDARRLAGLAGLVIGVLLLTLSRAIVG